MKSRKWLGVLVCVAVVCGAAASAGAQETRKVVIGARYNATGVEAAWIGSGYRDLWTTPVEVPVLDLQKTGGGLTPVRVVGQAQGLGLAFKGADGRAYTFRSLHKHPERMLPEEWRDRFPAKIAQELRAPTPTRPPADPRGAAGGGRRRPSRTRDSWSCPTTRRSASSARPSPASSGRSTSSRSRPRTGAPGFMDATEILSTTELWEALARRPGEPDRQPGLPPGPRHRPLGRQLRPPPRAVALDADPRRAAPAAVAGGPGHGARPPRRAVLRGMARAAPPDFAEVRREVPDASSRGRSRTTVRGGPLAALRPRPAAWRGLPRLQVPVHRPTVIEARSADAAAVVRAQRAGHRCATLETRRDGLVDYVLRVYALTRSRWTCTRRTRPRS